METINVLKICTAILTVAFAVISGYIEIRKNPQYWLNRFFAGFFLFAAIGFLFYTLYHLILSSPQLVVLFAMVAQVFFNIAIGSLLMAEFIIEYSEKRAVSFRFLLMAAGFSLITSVGYAVWPISLNLDKYALGEVDTITPPGWFYAVFIARILIMVYVMAKFAVMAKKTSGSLKKQLHFFIIGMVFVVLGTLFTLLGGAISGIFEIVGQFAFDAGAIFILQGFLLHESQEKGE